MKYYWDTSALINAAASPAVRQRLAQKEGFTRTHALAEFFARMTKQGIVVNQNRIRFEPEDAVAWLKEASQELGFVELEAAEVIQALDRTKQLGVEGPRVYDYLHGKSAVKGQADKILTRDNDFKHLGLNLPCEKP